MMRSSKVSPLDLPRKKRLTVRARRFGQWLMMPLVAVSGYIYLGIGCCVPNPTLNMVLYEDDYPRSNDTESCFSNYVQSSLGAGITGVIGTVMGASTLGGCFGTYSPRQMGL